MHCMVCTGTNVSNDTLGSDPKVFKKRNTVWRKKTEKMKKTMIVLICITLLVCFSGSDVYAKSKKSGNQVARGVRIKISNKSTYTPKIKGKIVTDKKQYRYFVPKNKKEFKNGFVTYKSSVYFVNKAGKIKTGWMKYKGSYYYLDRKTGKMAFSKKVDGIKINKYGVAKLTPYLKKKVDVYIEARKVIEATSVPRDSVSKRLFKAYKYISQFSYVRFRTYKEAIVTNPDDWDIVFANDIFLDNNTGCCISSSAAFAYVAVELGYKNVSLCSDTEHAWVDIGGRMYDLIFAKNIDFKKNYNAVYTDEKKANPPVKKTIN